MKKSLLIVCLIACISPAFAQGGKVIKAGAQAARGTTALTQQVSRQVAKHVGATSHVILPLQFVNLPASGTAPVVPAQLIMTPAEAQKLTLAPDAKLVHAEFFSPRKFERHMKEFDDLGLYIVVNVRHPTFYRGMVLSDLSSLRDVLTKGLERKKTNYNRIFASRYLSAALDYAYINPGQLPVLVQIPETDCPFFNVGEDIWSTSFSRDIPADALARVMVFLKIGEKPGWYDVKWQDDKLVFSRVPTDLDEILERK